MKNFQNKQKIIKVSIQLRALARIGLILWTAGLLEFLFITATLLGKGSNTRSIYISSGGIVEMVLAMVICWNFFRFFDRLKNGELFDARTVGYLEAAGRWWFIYWLMDLLFGLIGNGIFETKMTLAFSFGHLFASVMVIFVAWLLKEAQGLQEEQELTV